MKAMNELIRGITKSIRALTKFRAASENLEPDDVAPAVYFNDFLPNYNRRWTMLNQGPN